MYGNAVVQQALQQIQEILKGAPSDDVIKTLLGAESVRKDYPSGLVAYDLEPAARVLQPVITPLRNRLPRVKGKGGAAANWKQITSLDVNKTNMFPGFGTKANVVSYTSSDRAATYKSLALGDNVSIEAIQQAQGLEDARANMAIRLLENVMIIEEQVLIAGRSTALAAVTAPTVTTAAGGSIGAATYYVTARALTGIGRSPTVASGTTSTARGRKSTQTSIVVAASGVINATVPIVDGAVGYEWFVGTGNDNTTGKLEAVTFTNSVSLSALAGTGGVQPADNSADSLSFDGFLSQASGTGVFGNFGYTKQLATGTPGVGTPFSLTDIDTMLTAMFQTYGADPDAMIMSPNQAMDFTAKCRAAGLLRAIVQDNSAVGQLVGGARVTSYANPITGKLIDIAVDPWWYDGSIMPISFGLPVGVPLGEIKNAYEVKTQLDYYQLEYAITAPKYEIEVRTLQALATYFLLGTGILSNIARG